MIIASNQYRRPQYTRQWIDALRRCRGIERATIVAHCDGGPDADPETARLLQAIDFCPCRVTVHDKHMGISAVTLAELDEAFSLDDYAILLDEDILLAPDALEYHAWAANCYCDNPNVMSVAVLNREDPGPDDYFTARKRNYFAVWGAGFWRSRWQGVIRDMALSTTSGWDVTLADYVIAHGLQEVYPVLGRMQNIGAISSLHSATWFTPEWHKANHHVEVWAGDGREIGAGEWREVC